MITDNWKSIVEENERYIGEHYTRKNGEEYVFSGLLHADDDYYFSMWDTRTKYTSLYSCVASLKQHGFSLKKRKRA